MVNDNLTPETFYTYQIVFVPDMTKKFALKVKGGVGEIRAAINLVNGWQFTGLGPFYMKDSSTAQNTLSAGIAANLAARGVGDLVKDIASLGPGSVSKGTVVGQADVQGGQQAQSLIQSLQDLHLQPVRLFNYAEITIYEAFITPEGTMEWRPVHEKSYNRDVLGAITNPPAQAPAAGAGGKGSGNQNAGNQNAGGQTPSSQPSGNNLRVNAGLQIDMGPPAAGQPATSMPAAVTPAPAAAAPAAPTPATPPTPAVPSPAAPAPGATKPKTNNAAIPPPRQFETPALLAPGSPDGLPEALPAHGAVSGPLEGGTAKSDVALLRTQAGTAQPAQPVFNSPVIGATVPKTPVPLFPQQDPSNQPANPPRATTAQSPASGNILRSVEQRAAVDDPVSTAWLAKRMGLSALSAAGTLQSQVPGSGPITVNQYAAPVSNAAPAQSKDGHRWFHRRKRESNVTVRSTSASGIGAVPLSAPGQP
jgi:hypothetical protein